MMENCVAFANGPIFDGEDFLDNRVAVFENSCFSRILPGLDVPPGTKFVDLKGDILSPGYVDLQVNGGGGVMFNDDPSPDTLRTMVKAHRGLGVVRMLPTLISDTREKTEAAISSAVEAIELGLPEIAGLHLEGPHLSVVKKGAHDAAVIRSMEASDLEMLCAAAERLPCLMVTIAPENVSESQAEALCAAGVVVSLGHTDAPYDTCQRYFSLGVKGATHLFNAMSQINSRAPGLAGAALAHGAVSTGLIADGVHVHPEVMRMAWQSKKGPGRIYLVSDAMAVAGTDLNTFQLGSRAIHRQGGELRLADGTLAGADLDLTKAISVLVNAVGLPLAEVLRAATIVPAEISKCADTYLRPSRTALHDFIRIASDLSGLRPILA